MRSERIAQLLPEVFQLALAGASGTGDDRDLRMAALLDAQEEMHAPIESTLDGLADLLNPVLAREAFLPYLSSWLDLDRLVATHDPGASLAIPPARARLLLSGAGALSRRRGTKRGLIGVLEAATGAAGFAVDEEVVGEDGRPRDFHIRVTLPADAEAQRALVDRLVAAEKPAWMTYELASASAPAAEATLPAPKEGNA